MAVVFSNNATTVLSSNITNSATSIAVQDGSVFPTLSGTDYFYATLQDTGNTKREIVKVTARSGNTLSVTRAVDGSSASAFSANDALELRLNAAALNDAVNSSTPGDDTVSTAKIVDGAVTPAKLSLTYATETFVGAAVSSLVDDSQVLTDVPANALFTDTVYTLPFTDNSTNWNTAYGWGDHSTGGYLTSHQSLSGYATETYVGNQITNLVDSAPATMDTLNELAAALGDDPNFATTVSTSIGTKLPLAGGTLTGALSGTSFSGTYFSDGYVTWTAAQFNRYGAAIELQYTPTNSATLVKIGANGSNPTTFNAYTGQAAFTGALSGTTATFSGSVTAPSIRASSGDFHVNRSSDGASAIRVDANGVVVIPNNYFYVSASQGSYFSSTVRFRGTIHNDTGTDVTIGDTLNVTEGIKLNGTNVIDSGRNLTNIGTISSGEITSTGAIKSTAGGRAVWASSTNGFMQVGPNGGGASGVFGTHRETTGTGALDYTTYIGYDTYYDDATKKWYANRTNLGRKWKVNFGGYHQNKFTISTYDGGGTSGSSLSAGWLEADWYERFSVDPSGNNGVKVLGNIVWHAGNDGSGSGLDADLLDGYNTSTSATANTVVVREGSGHIYGNYILGSYFNASSGNSENPTIGQIWTQSTGDDYLRKSTPAHLRSQLGLWWSGNDGSGSGLDADLFDGRDSISYVFGASGYGTTNSGFASLTNAKSGFFDTHNSGTPTGTWYSLVNMAHYGSNHGHQIAGSFYSAGDIYNRNNNNTSLGAWAKIWNTANDGSGSGLDADLLDGIDSNRIVYGTNTSKVYRWDGDWNTMFTTVNTGFIDNASGTNGNPDGFTHHHGFQVRHDNMTNQWGFQFMGSYHPSYQSLYHRNVNAGTWSSWKEIWDSGNDGSGSGLDADLLDGQQGSYYAPASHAHSNYIRSDADDAFTGNLTTGANNHITFGPNSTWGSSLRVGGNGRTATGTEMASMVTTDGNLHLDAANSANGVYLNYYAGTNGVFFGNGAGATTARMQSNGQLYKSGGTTNPYWNSTNDGSGSGLDADLLDGYNGGAFLKSGAGDAVSGWWIDQATNGNSGSPKVYLSHSSGYGMHINTYNTNGGVYALELHNNSNELFAVRNNGDIRVNSNRLIDQPGNTYSTTRRRRDHHTGHLEGSYNNVGGNGVKSNPIYTIGSNYNPADASLSNMYGIGFTSASASFISGALNTGDWGMYVAAGGTARVWLDATQGRVVVASDMRSPIYYDSNNTGYYLHPDSTSNLNAVEVVGALTLHNKINLPSGSSSGTTFGANHYSMGVDIANGGWSGTNYSDLIIGYHTGIRIGGGYSGVRFYNNSPTTDANNDGNGDSGEALLMTIGGGGTSTSGSNVVVANSLYANDVRAPIFYDSNNTAYYVDGGSESRLETLRTSTHLCVGGLSNSAPSGLSTTGRITFGSLSSDAIGNYSIGTTLENYGGNYNKLDLAFHTGIRLGAHPNYGGVRFYADQTMASEIFAVGKSGNFVQAVHSMRAPLWYDSNNTGFYFDGSSTGTSVRISGDVVIDQQYGKGVVGVYGSTILQHVWSMGAAYRISANGNGTGNMYGLAWSHPNAGSLGGANNLNDHGLLLINNGSFRAAISSRAVFSADVRGTLFYDYNNTGYYVNPDSLSNIRRLNLGGAATTTFATPNVMSYASSNTAGAAQYHIRFVANNGNSNGSISTNYYQTTYAATSDYRVKEDFQPMVNATSRLMSLKPVNFQWKDSDIRTDGFLAHEVAEVVPEAVVGEKDAVDEKGNDELQSLDPSKLVPLLVKTIQEQQSVIEALEARISALEA